MTLKRKFVCFFIALFFIALLAPVSFAAWYLWAGKEVFAGYGAKLLASGVFVAGRSAESVAELELAPIPFLKYRIDSENKTATAWTVPGHEKTAVFREGLGVAIAHDGDVDALRQQARPGLNVNEMLNPDLPWPMGDGPSGKARPKGIDEAKLAAAVNSRFHAPEGILKRHCRAIVVVYDDEIVAEKYADGFNANQRFSAWSMTKSITHALFGIAVRQGKLSIQDKVPFWQDQKDGRADITIDMLLRMSSGLGGTDMDFMPPTALTTMLFLEPGAGDYASTLTLLHPPDTVWAYASSGTNLLSLILRRTLGDADYYALPYQELFSKVGMRSALIEADATGTFVGSSFMYATARDFARFGLLYLHDGVWQAERILPEGWVDYARTPTPTAGDAHYGAHWWLISRSAREAAKQEGWAVPEDTFFASGFEGQFIIVAPSRKLVIVQLNLDLKTTSPLPILRDVLAALP